MPAPTADKWEHRIRLIAENHLDWSAPRIRKELLDKRAAWDERAEDVPGERTVRRIRARHFESDEHERSAYKYLVWPDSFDAGFLPKASVRVLLDEIAYWGLPNGNNVRPTVRWARWYWRLFEAADVPSSEDPELTILEMRWAASTLSALDVAGELTRERYRSLEMWLAYRAWTGGGTDGLTYGPEVYRSVIEEAGIEAWDFSQPMLPVDDAEKASWILAEFEGIPFREAANKVNELRHPDKSRDESVEREVRP